MTEATLFAAALEKTDPAERAAFLEQACAGDAGLRARVEALLRSHEGAGNFLAGAAGVQETTHPAAPPPGPPPEGAGTRVGPYKLLQRIGEGGMGEVWMAEQQEPVRRLVALKVIKAGMDSRQVIARFEAERQALALMDHPHIAKVLDAGTTAQGRPYFVMELVKGVPITQYADAHRLTPRERLALFVPVCQALQHAHQKGIIHRDIKPTNVLVASYDGRPVPKVIDFGVAKATGQRLTERTLFTSFGSLVGTLEYMSPEQAEFNALDIDTRSDVYALGVLLYELLTGTTPLTRLRVQRTALTEALRLIREEEPPRPSQRLSSSEALASVAACRNTEPALLTRLVRGELDWLVMKALEKDRGRRYETANGLARDIERYLADEPMEACPPSARYRLHKFLRRHRGPVLAAALVLLALVAGIAAATWGLVRAEQARAAEADQRALVERERNDKEGARSDAEASAGQARQAARAALQQARRADEEARKARTQRDEARRNLYAASLPLAQRAWQETHITHMRELLEAVRPRQADDRDLRGFEWHYLWRLCHTELATLKIPTGAVTSVAFSPDGKRLAFTGMDQTVRVWDGAGGKKLLTLKSRTFMVTSVAFSPDGRRLACADGTTVRVRDLAGGKETFLIGHTGEVNCVRFSPDGKRLVSAGNDETVRVWDADSGKQLLAFQGHKLAKLAVMWAESLTEKGIHGQIVSVTFSPDGTDLASVGWDGVVRVWDAASGKELFNVPQGIKSQGGSVAFSPRGEYLAATAREMGTSGAWDDGEWTVRVWDTASRHKVLTLKGHKAMVTSMSFRPDGKRLASASEDRTVRVWDVGSGKELLVLKGHTGGVASVAFSPDGTRLASAGGDGTVRIWDAAYGQEVRTLKRPWDLLGFVLGDPDPVVLSAAFSPDSKRMASAGQDGTVRVWDVAGGKELLSLKGHTDWATGVAYSPDGARVAAAGADHSVRVWDAGSGKQVLILKGHTSWVSSVAFSPDGKRLASGSWDTTVRVWDATNAKEQFTLKGHFMVNSVAFSPEGKRLAAASDETVQVWDAADGKALHALKAHTSEAAGVAFGAHRVTGLAFSPDGKRLASASNDGTVRVWDVDGKELFNLKGHEGKVMSVAFSPDPRCLRLASAGEDRTVRLWDADGGKEVLTLKVPLEGTPNSLRDTQPQSYSVSFSPDGKRLAAVGWDGVIRLWDAEREQSPGLARPGHAGR
jgi:WD40 repeat protein/serine/threonine protein kinase